MNPCDFDKIVVWFSCGVASAVAAKRTIDMYSDICDVHIVNHPVAEEDADNMRFLFDVEKWIGKEIEISSSPSFPKHSAEEVWDKRSFMSGPHGAPCTIELKKKARQIWQNKNKPDWHVLGFTKDEQTRYNRFITNEVPNTLPILIEANLSKRDCMYEVIAAGIKPPRIYDMGYPNANCIGCVKATSASYWSLVREKHPDIYERRAEQSRQLGARLVRYKGERIFLDELPVGAKGRSIKSMTVECGIFCEEK